MKNYSGPEDVLISVSTPQVAYYSERSTYNMGENESDFDVFFNKTKPVFIMVSLYEQYPNWTSEWLNKNQAQLQIVNVWFSDAAKTQPSIIIYGIK
jgi:hypothetical protein